MSVELLHAGIPRLGLIAVHYWFVTNSAGVRERWEVWQEPNFGGASVGHLHRNLMHPDADVGGGPTRREQQWEGEIAQRIVSTLHESWEAYPHRHAYRAVPGPNSNTYVAWVLRQAKVDYRLSRKGIGKNYVP